MRYWKNLTEQEKEDLKKKHTPSKIKAMRSGSVCVYCLTPRIRKAPGGYDVYCFCSY